MHYGFPLGLLGPVAGVVLDLGHEGFVTNALDLALEMAKGMMRAGFGLG